MSTLKYPLTVANGKLLLSDNATAEAIISAIQTKYGERVFRNTYGNDLDEFTVTGDLSALIGELTEAIIDSTRDYLPLSLLLSGIILDDGRIQIEIVYDEDERVKTLSVVL